MDRVGDRHPPAPPPLPHSSGEESAGYVCVETLHQVFDFCESLRHTNTNSSPYGSSHRMSHSFSWASDEKEQEDDDVGTQQQQQIREVWIGIDLDNTLLQPKYPSLIDPKGPGREALIRLLSQLKHAGAPDEMMARLVAEASRRVPTPDHELIGMRLTSLVEYRPKPGWGGGAAKPTLRVFAFGLTSRDYTSHLSTAKMLADLGIHFETIHPFVSSGLGAADAFHNGILYTDGKCKSEQLVHAIKRCSKPWRLAHGIAIPGEPPSSPPGSKLDILSDAKTGGAGGRSPQHMGGHAGRGGGQPPHYNGGQPPHYNGGQPPHYNGGQPPHYNGGQPPHYNGGQPPYYNSGSPLPHNSVSPSSLFDKRSYAASAAAAAASAMAVPLRVSVAPNTRSSASFSPASPGAACLRRCSSSNGSSSGGGTVQPSYTFLEWYTHHNPSLPHSPSQEQSALTLAAPPHSLAWSLPPPAASVSYPSSSSSSDCRSLVKPSPIRVTSLVEQRGATSASSSYFSPSRLQSVRSTNQKHEKSGRHICISPAASPPPTHSLSLLSPPLSASPLLSPLPNKIHLVVVDDDVGQILPFVRDRDGPLQQHGFCSVTPFWFIGRGSGNEDHYDKTKSAAEHYKQRCIAAAAAAAATAAATSSSLSNKKHADGLRSKVSTELYQLTLACGLTLPSSGATIIPSSPSSSSSSSIRSIPCVGSNEVSSSPRNLSSHYNHDVVVDMDTGHTA